MDPGSAQSTLIFMLVSDQSAFQSTLFHQCYIARIACTRCSATEHTLYLVFTPTRARGLLTRVRIAYVDIHVDGAEPVRTVFTVPIDASRL